MHLSSYKFRISFFMFTLGWLNFVSASDDVSNGEKDPPDVDQDIEKRLYDFGLGKRAYRYANEYKRLPMYDFGLGKRSKMYSFGLGKREDEDGPFESLEDDEMPEIEVYDDDTLQSADKRAPKMYSFGLGKRPLYEFGLGKRASKQYSFGLGKRDKLYSFGLGKRGKMYSFGLGKREVNPYELESDDSLDAENVTATLDSHEEMGHGQTKNLNKRSPRQYSFGLGKRIHGESNSEFSRQFRKPPAYSFGLGKRQKNLYQFGLGKRGAPA